MTDDSAIHDLGYRRYEGAREGPRGAWFAIFTQGLRTMFGLGRTGKAKIVPVFVGVITMLQVGGSLIGASVSQGQLPVRYGNVLEGSIILYVLFIAAQAPEVFSRDQQHRILPLVLTRASSRQAYLSARLAAIVTSLFIVVFTCLFLLYIGQIGLAADPTKRFGEIGDQFLPVLAIASLTALSVGGLGAGISAWSPRRAFATASIIALFLLFEAISKGLNGLAGVASRSAELLSPAQSIHMLAMLLFDETNRGFDTNPPMDAWTYAGVLVAFSLVGVGLLQLRMRRLET
ncbi:MAG: hypothetical protein ABJB74_12640 [Gemmatimonas sp.]